MRGSWRVLRGMSRLRGLERLLWDGWSVVGLRGACVVWGNALEGGEGWENDWICI